MKYHKAVLTLLPALLALGFVGTQVASAESLFGGFRGFGGFGHATATQDQIASRQQGMFDAQAKLLNLSVDDIKNAWAEGKSLQQLAKEKGITQAQIQQRMKDAQTQALKGQMSVLVSKGIITQVQADKRLATVTAKQVQPQQKGERRGMMGRGGHHGFGF
ncbi:MAG: hypothetical protein Q7S47_00420 [bacterium]|nr:hypothetical protein [bacterium]